MKKIILICLILLLNSCSFTTKKKYNTEFNAKKDISFKGWEELPRLNNDIFESEAHNAYVDIYANKIGKIAYENQATLFPVGSIILKPLFNDESRKEIARLVIMVKREKGYDKKNGDWWYGVYDKSGKYAWHQGRIKSCIKCHKIAKKTDYLFTESVMEEIEMQNIP